MRYLAVALVVIAVASFVLTYAAVNAVCDDLPHWA